MSFSAKEVSLIRETWAPIRSDPANWNRLFLMLFTDYPEAQKLFKAFQNVPMADLPKNIRLKAHSSSVISLFSGFIDLLDQPETMLETVRDMAARHYKRNVAVPMFEALGVVIIKWLKEKEGDKINDEVEAAWTKLCTTLVSAVKAKYSELDKSS